MTDRPMRYPELPATEHLWANGREFLGHRVYATEKRDGANIHLWAELLDINGSVLPSDYHVVYPDALAFHGDSSEKPVALKVHVASRNQDEASSDFQHWVRTNPDFPKYVRLLAENPGFNIFVEYIPAGLGPTPAKSP